ncbi:GNAT superfamily N-acetyltransferase [Pseudomonas sp. BS3782 TE3695]|uniref:GNAT family N-acetyltransferase n=1 Tax=Pseudomonas sp. BS3782 TE3695 TaxID=3349323 RepID=UPI003D21706A
MLDFPNACASDDEWYEYAQQRCEDLKPHLENFILERFSYKPRYVQQRLYGSGITISALTKQYDLYLRLFIRPREFWPRECLVLARLMFKQQRAGHGRALVDRLLNIAPEFGYRYLAIECANANASAFARRMGFTPYEDGRHWVGSIEAIRAALPISSTQVA